MSKVNSYKPQFHIVPFTGWMNDPNGLSYFNHEYHIFFQACPDTTSNGLKRWGHYTTKDFISYHYLGVSINPDSPYDLNGVYSGSGVVYNSKLYLFYTGNVKLDGDYDYIYKGREGNTLRVESSDGINFTNKKLIFTNKDYPTNLSCHVRDPKIYQENDMYYMILGGRTKDDCASYIIYKSKDLEHFELFEQKIFKDLGYMLECPDVFFLDNTKVFSFSPQGVKEELNRFKNPFSSGYSLNFVSKDTYREWDLGYDFYAPQTLIDNNKNRIILIGWAGIDGVGYSYPTDKENYKHSLTLPRELKLINNKIYAYPIEEIFNLFDEYHLQNEYVGDQFAATFSVDSEVKVNLSNIINFTFNKNKLNAEFIGESFGRPNRSYDININKVLIINDHSLVEIYINDGEYVFTLDVFSKENNFIKVNTSNEVKICSIRSINIYE